LHFSPETERRLRERAAQTGQSVETYIEQLVEKEVTSPVASARPTAKTFDEILAPVRQGFAESGLTDEQLGELLEQAREEAWQEKQKKGPS
jgi:hypothetical protein